MNFYAKHIVFLIGYKSQWRRKNAMTGQQLYGFVLKTVAILVGIRAVTWLVQLPYFISGSLMAEGVRASGIQITVMVVSFILGFMCYVLVVMALFKWANPLAKRLAGSDAEAELRLHLEAKDLLRIAVIAIGLYFVISGVIGLIGQFLSHIHRAIALERRVDLEWYEINYFIQYGAQVVIGVLLASYRTWMSLLAKTRRA
jgi:hypothetical protein